MEVEYHSGIRGPIKHAAFFEGWAKKPSQAVLENMVTKSDYVVTAVATETGETVGLITAVTDGALAAYIPFLEVREDFRNQGVGTQLVKAMLAKLDRYYMIDLICDEHVEPFYVGLGFTKSHGMSLRNYDALGDHGEPPSAIVH